MEIFLRLSKSLKTFNLLSMNRIIIIFVLLLFSFRMFAEVPEKVSFQAIIRDGQNNLVTLRQIGMKISILQDSPNGNIAYAETQTPTTNINGLVSFEIGTGIQVLGNFESINWANGPYFIKTETDPLGGKNYTISGTSQLISVPYAIHAKTVDNITETDPEFKSSVAGSITTTNVGDWNNKLSKEIDGSTTNEIQALSIRHDTVFLSLGGFIKLPPGFDGNYNSLTNAPVKVSSFTNDVGYLTAEIDGSITNEIQTLRIGHDTIFLTNGGFVKLPPGFDGKFNSLTNVPANLDIDSTNDFDGQYSSLSGAPTRLSSFTNDVGYLTTEVDGSMTNEIQALSILYDTIFLSNGGFVKLPPGFDGKFNSLTNIPANLDIDSTNDFNGQYSSLSGAPTRLSSFTNDVGYLTTEVDGSMTNEIQALSILYDTIFLSNGGFVKLPPGFDGKFTSLTNIPANLDIDSTNDFNGQYSSLSGVPTRLSSFTNDVGYLTAEVDGSTTNEIQSLSIAGTVISLSNGGSSVTLPASTLSLDGAYDNGRTITADVGAVTVAGTDGFVSTGATGIGAIPTTGAGTRMMWYPRRAAFRAGGINGVQWDDANIGDYSFASGNNNIANEAYSTAFGLINTASGFGSTAMGNSTTASGVNSVSMNEETRASGDDSVAMGFRTLASGTVSTAMGQTTTASANFSTAMGINTTASGLRSTAMGDFCTASGATSTAMGGNTIASGDFSTSMGFYTTAEAYNSFTIGKFNIGGGNATGWGATDPLFEIGIGADALNKANAVTVLKNGKVGLITATPNANLEVGGIEGVLFTGTFGSGTIPVEGAGTRMMWYPRKAAFRAGGIIGGEWNNANIGDYSVAMGTKTTASGSSSIAIGNGTTATGISSTAMGENTTANGDYSTALGEFSVASGLTSIAMGFSSTANGIYSTAIGSLSNANGDGATAIGNASTASGRESTAIGRSNLASGDFSIALGASTTASGYRSTAMGTSVSTNSHTGSFIIGDNSPTNSDCDADNQMVMRFDGGYKLYSKNDLSIGVSLAAGGNAWAAISDSTKKENFTPADGEYFLTSLSKLKLGSWNYKSQNSKDFRHYGPMAQEIFHYFGNDGIGKIGCDTLLNSSDMDGIMMICLKALEERTIQLQKETSELKKANQHIEDLEKRLAAIEKVIKKEGF